MFCSQTHQVQFPALWPGTRLAFEHPRLICYEESILANHNQPLQFKITVIVS